MSLSEESDEILIFRLPFITTISWAALLTFDKAGDSENSVGIDFAAVKDFSADDIAENAGSIKYFAPNAFADAAVVNGAKVSDVEDAGAGAAAEVVSTSVYACSANDIADTEGVDYCSV